MKKILSAVLAIAVLLSLCACGGKDSGKAVSFLAKVTAVSDNTLTVTPDITSKEHRSSDSIVVSTPEGTAYTDASGAAIERAQLTVGSEIFISYDGVITETYPAGLTAAGIELDGSASAQTTELIPAGDTVTFVTEGVSQAAKANKLGLRGCHILVPAQDWNVQGAQGTKIGPVVISPKDSADVSLTLSIMENTAVTAAEKTLESRYGFTASEPVAGDDAQNWQGTSVIKNATRQFWLRQNGADTVALAAVYPSSAAEGYGAKLAAIAQTLTID